MLVDGDWQRPIPEPAVVAALPSGDEELAFELVPCSGHHSRSQEQQSLFSWAEFLTEQPDEPKPRGRNQQPSGPSLFDWALQREQEAGLVAAGS